MVPASGRCDPGQIPLLPSFRDLVGCSLYQRVSCPPAPLSRREHNRRGRSVLTARRGDALDEDALGAEEEEDDREGEEGGGGHELRPFAAVDAEELLEAVG